MNETAWHNSMLNQQTQNQFTITEVVLGLYIESPGLIWLKWDLYLNICIADLHRFLQQFIILYTAVLKS